MKLGVCAFVADSRVSGLDYRVDKADPLVVGEECTLHCVDGDFLEVIQGKPEGVCGGFELRVMLVSLINRLSVLSVTRNFSL